MEGEDADGTQHGAAHGGLLARQAESRGKDMTGEGVACAFCGTSLQTLKKSRCIVSNN